MSDAIRQGFSEEKVRPFWQQSLLGSEEFSYKDFKTWDTDRKIELDNGEVYLMASADERHNWIVTNLSGQLSYQLLGKKCQPHSEWDVRLFYEADESDKTVYRPDVIVVCDETKTKGFKNCRGAPDFVIEVVSELSEDRDLGRKKKQYEKAGVKEYWVVGYEELHVFILQNGKYKGSFVKITRDLKQPIACLEDCIIDFKYIADRYTT